MKLEELDKYLKKYSFKLLETEDSIIYQKVYKVFKDSDLEATMSYEIDSNDEVQVYASTMNSKELRKQANLKDLSIDGTALIGFKDITEEGE